MNRPGKIASAVLLAALSVGAAAPANAAILGHPHGHSATVKAHAHASHVSDKAVRQVLRDIAHLDKRLDRAAAYVGKAKVSTADRDLLLASIATDQADLATLADDVRTAGTVADLKAARRDLRQVRWNNYVRAAQFLVSVDTLAAQVAAQSAQAPAGSPEATLLADASTKLDTAAADARAITARTPKADLQAIRALLDSVAAAVGAGSTT
jgi:hypothetical protein